MPLYKTGKPIQEEYDADHSALLSKYNALAAKVEALTRQTVPPRVGGSRLPYSGAVQATGTQTYSPSAPSASVPPGGSGGIIVSDGTNFYPGVTTITFAGWTVTPSAGGVTVGIDFSGIDDS